MNEEIQEILDSFTIEEYLDAEGVDYKKTSGVNSEQANIRTCPVCGTSKFKVFVSLDTGLGNCFSGDCGATFNTWSFIKAHIGAERPKQVVDHIREFARTLGWRPKRLISVAVNIENEVKLPMSYPLPIFEDQNLRYLEERGITIEYAKYFHLRYCEEGWWNFIGSDGSKGGQNFRQRCIMPIFDLDGELVTFQGRDLTGTADRKYLFPATLPGTGRFLYNAQNAVKAKRVLMGEGSFDIMAAKIALDGDPELRGVVPIGSFGKHLSISNAECNDQLGRFLQLKRWGLEEVTIMWDGEVEALVAAVAAGEKLQKIGLRVRIALLPAGKDPNEVPASVVRQAYREAKLLTPALAVLWRIRNPYARAGALAKASA